jgi:excinuclease ABC subunit A
MSITKFSEPSEKTHIIIKGARVHNLKNVHVAIPRNKLVVITGLSGSGKSSLAFDTLFAEGQRRYVESLSSYARQFLGRMNKPDVDNIVGISPAVAIEQKVNSTNPRSTVGTSTEIYDYLKLLFARIGKTYSPVSGDLVKRFRPQDVLDYIHKLEEDTLVNIYAPLKADRFKTTEDMLKILMQQGFSRIKINGELKRMQQFLDELPEKVSGTVLLLIDRITTLKNDEDNDNRIIDSVQTAFFEGGEEIVLEFENEGKPVSKKLNGKFEADGITFEEPSVQLFSFNNPYGACKTCEGFGSVIGIDDDLVIPDKSLSVFDGAIACWKGEKMGEWRENFIKTAIHFDFPVHRSYYDLSEDEKKLLWEGNKKVNGINDFFKYVEGEAYKIQYRVMLSRYRGRTVCPDCKGTRLRKDANYVKISNTSISEIVLMPVSRAKQFFDEIELDSFQKTVAQRILLEIKNRLEFLCDVGLGYLSLNRLSSTLSGGESQRINLATSLGSSLVGSMYILDEPSIGLHSKDTERLIKVLIGLRDLGNTVIVVEHDEEIMQAADEIIDLGPLAGSHGGEIVFQGNHLALETAQGSLTADYLTGRLEIPLPENGARKWRNSIIIKGARQHNLKGIDVAFPLNVLTVVTGMSGSGKSTLVNKILFPALKKMFDGYSEKTGIFDRLEGDYKLIEAVEYINQNPIGKSSRSNPVTYVKAYDEIRTLFASQAISSQRGYKASTFSFNVEGGRCEACEGEGFVTISMQFMADIKMECEACGGKRFKDDVLEATYHDKNIFDILNLTVDDAIDFFGKNAKSSAENKILAKLQPLADVGLGYVKLGQASSTLSGGEAQRIKLASFLTKGTQAQKTLFIFDEPTTGLHFHDINKLLISFQALIAKGHSIVVIEHNTDVIKCADWVIDLGPEGGEKGGNLVFAGTPEALAQDENSVTGKFLKTKFRSLV